MPERTAIEVILDTPSSSGESEKLKESCQRKKKKLPKQYGSINPCTQIPRVNSATTHSIAPASAALHRSNENSGTSTSTNITSKLQLLPLVADNFKEPPKSVVAYRFRKSLSQMDMKQSKRNFAANPRSNFANYYSKIALPKPMLMQTTCLSNDMSHQSKKNTFYMVSEPETGEVDAKTAGMKVFATIMLNAWRRRRDDVKHLNAEIDQLRKGSIKIKNQIHVLNSVFHNEQKQNEKLNRQLRHANEDYQRLQSSVESLTTSLISAKAEASLFEQQLHAKEQENETLNNILTDTNSQLFKSMTQIRHLQTSLSSEQRNVQQLENQKNELLNELAVNEIKSKKDQEHHLIEIYQKDEDLSKANSEIKMLETLLLDLKEKEFQVRDLKKSECILKSEIDSLRSDISLLKTELNRCFGGRLKNLWQNYVDLHCNTLLLIHLGLYYLLPAIPPPRSTKLPIPITVSFEKVMSLIRD